MRSTHIILATSLLFGSPAFAGGHAATGDAAAGEAAFSQCVSCHVVVDEAGETLAGRNARTGPNLYGIAGNGAAQKDFRYGDGIKEAAAGEGDIEPLVWTEETFVAYVQDPTGFLREYTDNRRARGKMSYRVRNADDAVNLYAFLSQFGAAE